MRTLRGKILAADKIFLKIDPKISTKCRIFCAGNIVFDENASTCNKFLKNPRLSNQTKTKQPQLQKRHFSFFYLKSNNTIKIEFFPDK